jgi:hypothetical protein
MIDFRIKASAEEAANALLVQTGKDIRKAIERAEIKANHYGCIFEEEGINYCRSLMQTYIGAKYILMKKADQGFGLQSIFNRIDEVADITKWLISARGVIDVPIQKANELTYQEVVEELGGELVGGIFEEKRLKPLDVYRVYVQGKPYDLAAGIPQKNPFEIVVSSSDILHGDVTLLPEPPEGLVWVLDGIVYDPTLGFECEAKLEKDV